MKVKLNAKGKLLKVAEGKLKYHMSQNAMVKAFSSSYVGFSKGTINSICKLIDANKWTIDDIKVMNEEKCDSYLRPKQTKDHSKKEAPNYNDIHTQLIKDKNMTLFFLWRKYCKEHKDPYSYSRYCELYSDWCHLNKKAPVLVMNEIPGENCYIDWIGDKLDYCFDGEHIETVHFFVTSIGMSGYPYCEAFLDEKISSFINGHIHAFEYYGGVPKYCVPDNTKCATIKNYKHDIVLNKVYEEMQEHYGYVVIPARPKAPTDKNDAEFIAGWFERQLLMEIKDKQYSSLEELNIDILRITKELSDLPYQIKSGTRTEWFENYDRPLLKPLPTTRFEVYDYCSVKVPDNYHINISNDKNHYYSVPYKYLGQSVIVKYSFNDVIINDLDGNLIAKHKRSYTKFTYYSTIDEHMPINHQVAKNIKTKDSNWYLTMAKVTGEHVEKVVSAILASKKHPEQSYRACIGIISMHINHTYPDKDIEIVCKEACELNNMTYSFVSRRLKEMNKKVEEHENIRGSDEYY